MNAGREGERDGDMQGRGRQEANKRSMRLTVHIDTLLLAKGGTEFLNFGGQRALDVLGSAALVRRRRGRRERMGGAGIGGLDRLDEGMTAAEVLEGGRRKPG